MAHLVVPHAVVEKLDYMELPCPLPYEEIDKEALLYLKWGHFEGMRFDFNKWLNQRFRLSYKGFIGLRDIRRARPETIKRATSKYEFQATFIDPKLTMYAVLQKHGRVSGRLKCELSENLTMKADSQFKSGPHPHMSKGWLLFDYKGTSYRSQFLLWTGPVFGAKYIKNVTPILSLGGEVFWRGQDPKFGIGYVARYNTNKTVATGQVAAGFGMVSLSYVQKISEKVSLASDFMYNYLSKDVTASFGYHCMFRQCRLRGKIDSNGCVAAHLCERLNMGLSLLISAEVDHLKKDYKFGFGFGLVMTNKNPDGVQGSSTNYGLRRSFREFSKQADC